MLALVFLIAIDGLARSRAMSTVAFEVSTDAELKIALLNVALERPRVILLILSGDPDIANALDDGGR